MSSQRVELELLLASVFLELDLVPEGVDLEPEGVVFAHVVLGQRLEMLLVVAGVQALFVIVRAKILVELKRSLGRIHCSLVITLATLIPQRRKYFSSLLL